MATRAQPMKDHWKEQRLFLSRIIGAAVVVVLLTGVLFWRLVDLQIVRYARFSAQSKDNQIEIEALAPARGLIYDRKGNLLAENVPMWQLVAVPEDIENLDAELAALEALELLDPANRDVLIDTIRSHRRFERVLLTNLNDAEAATFAVRRHNFPGIHIQEGLVRYYPLGERAAHVVGYVGKISTTDLQQIDASVYAGTTHIGKTGIERAYEELLHGQAGYRQVVVNAQGRRLTEEVPEGGLEELRPVPGQHVVLSLDIGLQLTAQDAMAGLRGAVVAIDPRNGDVLALVSAPAFDSNSFATGMSQSEYFELSTDPNKPFLNRALANQYSPGSTVKPFLGLAGLHYETEHVAEEHYCNGEFRLPNSSYVYREGRRVLPHGETTLQTAIVRSCNVYFYGLAVELGIDRMEAFMREFGFGARTGIDIGGEYAGLVPGREWKRTAFRRREDQTWFPGETVNTGIGQGYIEVTPLQLASATATLAASGRRFQPRLMVGTEDGRTGEISETAPIELAPVQGVSEEHWAAIHAAMLGVTTELRGTGYTAMRDAPYTVAGKTGTAQVVGVAQDSVYDAEAIDERYRDNGLFIAYAPAENPEIAVAVIVENQGGGGSTAAPVARKVFDAYFGSRGYVLELASL